MHRWALDKYPAAKSGVTRVLREWRYREGLLQQDVADRLEVRLSTYRAWENAGVRPADAGMRARLAEWVGFDLFDL